MDIVHPVLIQFTTLGRRPLDTQLPGIFIRLTLHDFLGQRLWNVAVECLGYHRQLAQFRQWLDTWNNGNRDSHLTGFLHELEVFLIVKEQLRHRILRTQLLFLSDDENNDYYSGFVISNVPPELIRFDVWGKTD